MKIGNLMKQAQQMQEGFAKAQESVKAVEVSGEAGAGLVKVRMRGDMAVSGVEVDPSLMQEPREILEDLLAAAVNDAVRRAQAAAQECMASVTAGINLPDGFKMPI
ncbi:MAG: YbaB/EbfC family nucleoid-associated protein [Luminiphilus sp.]|nr:YbaB/EbfC family nucleoid-associated protein [Luminiphilus sp.]